MQLDCGNGQSLSVQFYVCTGIPFPLVSVARLLLQDFWTVMAKDYMALIDPTGNPVPIVRQGTLVYLTPTVIPYIWHRQCCKIGSNVFARSDVGD